MSQLASLLRFVFGGPFVPVQARLADALKPKSFAGEVRLLNVDVAVQRVVSRGTAWKGR